MIVRFNPSSKSRPLDNTEDTAFFFNNPLDLLESRLEIILVSRILGIF